MVQKAMLLRLLVLIINALSIPSQKILQSKISQIFKGCDTLSGNFFYKPWLVQQPRQITLHLSEKTFLECC